MRIDITQDAVRLLSKMTPDEQREWISKCSPETILLIDAAFEAWSAKGQIAPSAEGWRVWLMMAGRGFGKTRAGAEWIYRLGWSRPVRIALVAASIDEARAVMIEGVSGLLSVARRQRHKLTWEPSLGKLTWPRGSVAQLFSGDHPDGLRGPEHHFAWCDELAKWRQADAAWDNLQMGLRAGIRPRALVTTTPRPMALLDRISKDKWSIVTGGKSAKNINLPRQFVDVMMATYGGTRLGAQELDGELIPEAEGSLWPRELIERSRANPLSLPPLCGGSLPLPQGGEEQFFDRILVGVDPPAGAGEGSDACGIVVCGSAGERMYVLADESVEGLSPEGWANRVAATAARWNTSQVIAEANNGGVMVQSVLMAADLGLQVRLVHATKGKVARAEPIALRFETGRAQFAGTFPKLEAELGGLIAGGAYEGPGRSPDRADAMVWAMTVLGEARSGVPRVTRL